MCVSSPHPHTEQHPLTFSPTHLLTHLPHPRTEHRTLNCAHIGVPHPRTKLWVSLPHPRTSPPPAVSSAHTVSAAQTTQKGTERCGCAGAGLWKRSKSTHSFETGQCFPCPSHTTSHIRLTAIPYQSLTISRSLCQNDAGTLQSDGIASQHMEFDRQAENYPPLDECEQCVSVTKPS